MGGNGTVCRGGHDLPDLLCADIARRKYAGDIGAGGFVSHNIAGGIQHHLTPEQLCDRLHADADEQSVQPQNALLTRLGILQLYAGQFIFMKQLCNGSVP